MTRVTAFSVAVMLAATTAQAGDSTAIADRMHAPRSGWQLGVGAVVGGLGFDGSLGDYRWDTRPAVQAGAQATVHHGRVGAGLRILRAQTTQSSGIPGDTQTPRVNLTTVDIVGQARVAAYRGIELWGSAHGGRLHVGYDPDVLTFDLGGGAGPVTVEYKAVSEWDFGVGMALRADLTRQLALALQADGTTFALDTAHRSGSEIVLSRERFYTWSLHLQVSWLLKLG